MSTTRSTAATNEPIDYKYQEYMKVEYVDHMGNDERVAMAAWASTDVVNMLLRAQNNPKEVEGVINYLMKHRHGTPFEHNSIQFLCTLPIFVWREWHRHRIGMSYNEESGRYKTLAPVFYIPPIDRPMLKIEGDWKPSRPKFDKLIDRMSLADTLKSYKEIIEDMQQGYRDEYERYLRQLERGLDPGLARDNLPVGLFTTCWVTCNARSLMNFLSLRVQKMKPEATFPSFPLYEIDQAAQRCEEIFRNLFPITHKAFIENGRVAP